MKTSNFDAIAASAPLNRQASVVRDGSGDHWEAGVPADINRWLAPPRMTSRSKMSPQGLAQFDQTVGRRFGRLVVLGIWADGNNKKNATWVVRCDCGAYEGRRLRGLAAGTVTMCSACQRAEDLRNTKTASGPYRKASEKLLARLTGDAA